MLPELDYKRIVLAVLLVIISIALFFGIIWLIFLRAPSGGPTSEIAVVSPGGELPETTMGEGGSLLSPGGFLPGSTRQPAAGGGSEQPAAVYNPSAVARGSLTQVNSLIDEQIRDIFLTSRGFNYLSGADDKFYNLTAEGNKMPLSSESFPYVENATWSPNGDKVILEYPDGANIIYNFNSQRKITLPRGLEGPDFDRSSERIAYKYISNREEDNWLVVSKTDSSDAQAVEAVGDQGDKVQINWSPNNQIVALYHNPIGLNKEEVIFIGLHDENYKSLIVEGSNFKGKWSPTGNRILYHVVSSDNDYNPVLWIADSHVESIGNNNFNLGLSTWVDKCVFAGDNQVYCAVPVGLPQGAGIYPDLVNDKPDVFYEINLNSGISKLIAMPVLSEKLDEFQVKKLFINSDKSKLYFLDGLTEKVYYLRLK